MILHVILAQGSVRNASRHLSTVKVTIRDFSTEVLCYHWHMLAADGSVNESLVERAISK